MTREYVDGDGPTVGGAVRLGNDQRLVVRLRHLLWRQSWERPLSDAACVMSRRPNFFGRVHLCSLVLEGSVVPWMVRQLPQQEGGVFLEARSVARPSVHRCLPKVCWPRSSQHSSAFRHLCRQRLLRDVVNSHYHALSGRGGAHDPLPGRSKRIRPIEWTYLAPLGPGALNILQS